MLFEQKSRRKSNVEIEVYPYKSLTTLHFLIRFPLRFLAAGNKITSVMLFEQKSRRKSSVEIEVYPYKSLTTFYFLIRFPQRFLASAITIMLG